MIDPHDPRPGLNWRAWLTALACWVAVAAAAIAV
jgi:hypothetical protein